MRSFGAAALVVGLTASQCAAQVDEQASSQLYNQLSRLAAESQKGESLRERKLGHDKKKKHKDHGDEVTETATTALPDDDRQRHSHTGPHTRQQNESCSVCGEGMEVGNPDGLVVFPGQAGQIPCGILENMGKLGLIPAPQCAVLPQLIGITCECQASTGPTVPATTTPGSITTTEATKPGGSKGGKSIGHSMSVPAKAGKSIHGKASSLSTDIGGWSSGGSLKTVISTKAIKASSAKAEKSSSSSSGGSKGGKASSSSSGGSKGGKGSVHEWSTEDAKAHKVKGETKSSPKAEKTPPAKDPPPPPPPPPAKKSKTTKDTKAKKASSSGGKSAKGSTGGGAPPTPPAPGGTDDWSGPASSWENNGN